MLAPWVLDELKAADLNDKRLDKRLMQVVDQFGKHSTASIPAACGGAAELTAASRPAGGSYVAAFMATARSPS